MKVSFSEVTSFEPQPRLSNILQSKIWVHQHQHRLQGLLRGAPQSLHDHLQETRSQEYSGWDHFNFF